METRVEGRGVPKVTQLIRGGLGWQPRQSLWDPHPYLLYHNALSIVHPSAAASGAWLDLNNPQNNPDRAQVTRCSRNLEGQSGAGLSLPSNRAADGNWGGCQGIFFQAGVGVMG